MCLSLSGAVSVSRWDWLSVFTYTVNFRAHRPWVIGHIWSLSIEEQFYLVWPALIMLIPTKVARKVVAAGLLFEPALRLCLYLAARLHVLLDKSDLKMIDSWSFTRADSIGVGCLLALLAIDPVFRRRLAPYERNAAAWLTGAAGTLCASMALGLKFAVYGIVCGYTVNALCIAAIIWLCIARHESRLGSLLQSRSVAFVGVLSYSLYLWQQLFLVPHHSAWACQWPQNICLAIIAGLLSYYVVERPFLRIKDRRLAPQQVELQAAPTIP
jgi:peptidoglycan/LPS O-acetylase OafA/YrhL